MAESDYVAIVARVLRDTEHLRLVLAVTTSAHHPALCALIVHVNDARDIEEAAILLLHRPSAPILAAAVPLHANFGFDVEQLQPDPSEKGTARSCATQRLP